VGIWTRELIDAVVASGGTYYLPYQLHATPRQFHRAYPKAEELFALKRKLDPGYRLRNALWDKYFAPTVGIQVQHPIRIGAAAGAPLTSTAPLGTSEFHTVMSDVGWHDRVYGFLHNVFRLYPEDRFNLLIKQACERHAGDEAIYRYIQQQLPTIKPALADFRFAIPALAKQKAEMSRQTLELLGERRRFDDYLEIGSTGRYVSSLRKHVAFGSITLLNEYAPNYSPPELLERGRLRKLGRYLPLRAYAPLSEQQFPDASLDFVSCYVGLHHMTPETLSAFTASIARVLRPGGIFVLRDHDVRTPEMFRFVSLIHTIFNAGTGASWEQNRDELRYFASIETWVERLSAVGLVDRGARLLQPNDPSDNALMAFSRGAA
jgi:SAM-dependent methyltransferase